MYRVLLLLGVVTLVSCELTAINQSGLTSETEVLLTAPFPGESFGASFDFLGDINSDGFQDIAIGAPGSDERGLDSGCVSILLGPTATGDQGVRICGQTGEAFGSAVIGPGDLSGDGIPDLVVAATGSEPTTVYLFSGSRLAALFTGSTTLTSIDADLRISGLASGIPGVTLRGFGSVLSSAGDINRDGRLDLAIGAPDSLDISGFQTGAVFIFFGGLSLTPLSSGSQSSLSPQQAELRLTSSRGGRFGGALSHAGDPNSDFGSATSGITLFGDDLLIGAPSADGGGEAYLLLGTDGVSGLLDVLSYPRVKRLSRDNSQGFGQALAATGDLDGDAIDDIAVAFSGGVTLFQGFQEIGTLDGFQVDLLGDVDNDGFGTSISGGRGHIVPQAAGLLVGAPLDAQLGTQAGAAYLFLPPELEPLFTVTTSLFATATASAIFRGDDVSPNSPKLLGNSVRLGGDLNGDGGVDALLGLPAFALGGANSGGVLTEL